jgi:hypothetical protein
MRATRLIESPLWILLNSPLVTQLGVSALAIGAAISAARIMAASAVEPDLTEKTSPGDMVGS